MRPRIKRGDVVIAVLGLVLIAIILMVFNTKDYVVGPGLGEGLNPVDATPVHEAP